jgi:hypothetical protein
MLQDDEFDTPCIIIYKTDDGPFLMVLFEPLDPSCIKIENIRCAVNGAWSFMRFQLSAPCL